MNDPYPIEAQMLDAEANWLVDPRDNDDGEYDETDDDHGTTFNREE